MTLARRQPEFGSLEWACANDGLLCGWGERARLLSQGVAFQLGGAGSRVRAALTGPRANLDLDRVAVPDGAAARAAERLVDGALPAVWANHSRRCFLWACALAHADGVLFDAEVLYVASLVHDVGLVGAGADATPRCFSLPAAERADDLARAAGWPAARRRLLADTIVRHLNLRVPRRRAPEAYLLHASARLDIVGYRYADMAPQLVGAVLERYPRLGFKDELRAKMRARARLAPDTRPGFYQRFAADRRRARAPFPD